jgi:integrase
MHMAKPTSALKERRARWTELPQGQRNRRGAGEGSLYQRQDGRWVARVIDTNGRSRSLYARTYREAEQKLHAARRAVEDGFGVPDQQPTLGAYLTRWLENLPTTDVKPATVRFYTKYVEKHVLTEPLARRLLSRLTPGDLAGLYSRKLASGLSRTTVNHLHRLLHRALRVAEREGIVSRNAAAAVDGPGRDRVEFRVLHHDEPEQFLEAVSGEPLEALFVVALCTGMRQGELLALRWQNVDLLGAELEVVGSLTGVRRADLEITSPKSKRARRVALPPQAVASLREHRRRQHEHRLAMAEWVDRGLVFAGPFGDFMRAATVNSALDRVLVRAGLPHMRFHDLRHSAATRMLARGIHPKVVAECLGHASIQTTMDLYGHVAPSMLHDAMRTAWGPTAL